MKAGKLLVVGWDGAEPSIVDRMLQEGKLPNLARIKAEGAYGRVRTTVPDTSLAAWTSALTGLNPGRHGMVNFVRRPPGKYELRLVDATDRLVPTILAQAHMEGCSVASFGVPGTWPTEPQVDLCIAGFDSPLASSAPRRAFQPRSLYTELERRGLAWPYGGVDELSIDSRWHERTHGQLLENIDRKQSILQAISRPEKVDLLWVVFSESDTAGHHFWAYSDQGSPRYKKHPALPHPIEDIYARLDENLGKLVDSMDPGASVMVLSDHGFMGASEHVVYINRWLASKGFLKFKPLKVTSSFAPPLMNAAARMVPARIKEWIIRTPLGALAMGLDAKVRFGFVDLHRSRAFCDELPQNPGIWLNVKGREPHGMLGAGDEFTHTMDLVAEGLLKWRHAHTGRPVVSRVLRRQDAMSGPGAVLSPDMLVELAHWDRYRLVAGSSKNRRYPLVRKLDKEEMIGPKGLGTSGAHSKDGIFALMGPGVQKGSKISDARLEDVAPSLLRILGLEPPAYMDGCVLKQLGSQPGRPMKVTRPVESKEELTLTESAAIERKLEALGYK